jgi:hypothetical protein
MSTATLIAFKDGKECGGVEFRNSWGGAARIWNALFAAYVPKKHQWDTWASSPDDRRLWDLATRQDLLLFERAVHAFTFDRFYVRRENFHKMAANLREFVAKYPAGESADHLPAWAKWLEDNPTNADAVGLYATSVSENPWRRPKTCEHCGHKTDETESIPLSEGNEVFGWLEGITV